LGLAADSYPAAGGGGQQNGDGPAGGSGSQTPVDGPSGQQSSVYAARIALAFVQYHCHNCEVMGHWKKDNLCKPADVVAHIRKRIAEQVEADREDGEDTGNNLYTCGQR
jgi:hypothetical protein